MDVAIQTNDAKVANRIVSFNGPAGLRKKTGRVDSLYTQHTSITHALDTYSALRAVWAKANEKGECRSARLLLVA